MQCYYCLMLFLYVFHHMFIINITIMLKNAYQKWVTLVCEYFRDVRKKYIKSFYYQRSNMMKFLDLMTSVSKKDRFRLMLFSNVVFKMYAETL